MSDVCRHLRYENVATREIITGGIRQPQWNQAMREAGGDSEMAARLYVSIRTTEIEEGEAAYESALERLKKLRHWNDVMMPLSTGRLILLLLVAVAATIGFWYSLQWGVQQSQLLK